jgi:hypothetical protein
MEVHHHPIAIGSHTARKKWTHYFWEFFMLFLAVTLGFFVENQREHYIEHQRSANYAENLLYDLSRDTSRLNDLNKYQVWKENKLDFLITTLSSGKTQVDALPFYQSLRALDSWKVTLGYSNTYDDLKTSGLLRYYTQKGLANQLKAYYAEYGVLNAMEREAEKFHIEVCEPFLDQHFEGLNYLSSENGNPEPDKLLFPVAQDNKIIIPTETKKQLLNIVVRLKHKKGMYKSLQQYADQKQTALSLITLLKKEYHLK